MKNFFYWTYNSLVYYRVTSLNNSKKRTYLFWCQEKKENFFWHIIIINFVENMPTKHVYIDVRIKWEENVYFIWFLFCVETNVRMYFFFCVWTHVYPWVIFTCYISWGNSHSLYGLRSWWTNSIKIKKGKKKKCGLI